MGKQASKSRRNFLKASAAGAAGLALVGPGLKKASAADLPVKLIPLSTTKINQDIDNLRVAYITDAAMVRSNVWGSFVNFCDPNGTVNGAVYPVIKSNMDKLACALANKADAGDAWSTIFKLAPGKSWGTAKAAIKINSIGGATDCVHASVPILAKVIEVLIGKGMPAGNIVVFDMTKTGAKDIYSRWRGTALPAGIVFGGVNPDPASNNNIYTAKFPAGYSMDASQCIDGVDIYVNIANNKGHDQTNNYSGVTMSLKNNFGTVCFGHNGMDQLAASNSCDYIIGNPSATMPAKQQLCIVDSLFLGNAGDWAGGTQNGNNANSIVMGTFAGAVDYVATKVIRIPKIPGGINSGIVDQFLTKFGYTTADGTTITTITKDTGKGLVDASNWQTETLPRENQHLSREGVVQISVAGSGIKTLNTTAYLSKGESVRSAEIFTVQGRKVRTLSAAGTMHIVWDGKANSGSLVPPGSYIVKVQGSRTQVSSEVLIQR
jgi:hypothetical protein